MGSRTDQTIDCPVAGLPPSVSLRSSVRLDSWASIVEMPGGSLGGHVQTFDTSMFMNMVGTGGPLSGFSRTLRIPMPQCVTHSGPRTPGDSVQTFDTSMFFVYGELPPGDPDFDLLKISAGSSLGLRSPGHTTLTRLPNGTWAVDSFFDVFYTCEFVGKAGGALSGMSGSTTGTIRLHNSHHAYSDVCVERPFITPIGPIPPVPGPCPITSDDTMHIIDGLPPANSIECAPAMQCQIVTIAPGGSLGGTVHSGPPGLPLPPNGQLQLIMHGDGSVLSAFSRTVVMPVRIECELAPLSLSSSSQTIPNAVSSLTGQLPPGDPDFDLLRITGGSGFGLPSPGHTTLTRLPTGDWAVDSFFDITYRIDFVGNPAGSLAGMSGSTTATIRMQQGETFPVLKVPFSGFEFSPLGAVASLDSERASGQASGRRLSACCLGSSGQDGVVLLLRASDGSGGGGGGGSGGSAVSGAQGHRLSFDWAPDALPPSTFVTLPQGAGMRVASFFDIFFEDPEPRRECRLNMVGQGGNQIGMSVSSFGFDLPAVQVQLRLHGQVVGSQSLLPPYLPGPMAMCGFAASQEQGLVVDHRLMRVGGGTGLPDTLEICVTNPFDAVCSFPGLPTTTADQMCMRVSLNGLPPGTRYIGFDQVQVTGGVPQGMPPMELHVQGTHIKEGLLTVRVRESPSKASGVRIAVGDVDGDSVGDLAIRSIPEADTSDESLALIEADLDGDGTFDPLRSVSSTVHFGLAGDTSPLGPNGSLRSRPAFFDIFVADDVWVMARRCDGGACPSTEMVADFSGLGATTVRCQAYDGATLVADVTGIPIPPGGGGVVCATLDNPLSSDVTITSTCTTTGAMRCDWSWGVSNRATMHVGSGGGSGGRGGTGGPVQCTRLVFTPENATIPVEMVAMELQGTNLCELGVTDLSVVPVPACSADVAPPGGDHAVNVTDLLKVISEWGACDLPCPPCPGDVNRDCVVNVTDLLAVISGWGTCPGGTF